MAVRRTDSGATRNPLRPKPTGTPIAAKTASKFKPAAAAAAKNFAISGRSAFQTARAAPIALDIAGPASFTRPTQGEWTVDSASGRRSDPVTLYVHGSLEQIEQSLGATGWTEADPKSPMADLRYVGNAVKDEISKAFAATVNHLDGFAVGIAGVFGLHVDPLVSKQAKPVPGVDRMPVSPQTYRGQKMIAAFEKNNDPLGGRDHLRLFATGEKDAQGRDIYAIAASHDTGIRFAPDHPECAFLFHDVQPNVDAERNNVLGDLESANPDARVQSFGLPFGAPSSIGEYVGDAKAFDVTL